MEPKLDQSVEIYQKSPDDNSKIRYDINSAFHTSADGEMCLARLMMEPPYNRLPICPFVSPLSICPHLYATRRRRGYGGQVVNFECLVFGSWKDEKHLFVKQK